MALGLRAAARSPAIDRAERLRPSVLGDEPLRRADDLERVRLALLGRLAPGGDAVAAEDRRRWPPGARAGCAAMSRPSWKPGRRQATQATRSPKQRARQRLAVGGGRERDARVGMEVVDVGGVDQAVHRGVDRRRRAAAAVEAVVERGDHLVLALDARVDVDQRAQAVEAQDGQPGLGQRAEVAAGALDPQQLDGRAGDRVDARCPWPTCCRRRSSCCAGRAQPVASARAARRRRLGVGSTARCSCAPPGLLAADPLGDDPLAAYPERA